MKISHLMLHQPTLLDSIMVTKGHLPFHGCATQISQPYAVKQAQSSLYSTLTF